MLSFKAGRVAASRLSQRESVDVSVAAKAEGILSLAKSKAPADREQLLLAIADLCDQGEGAQSIMRAPPLQALLSSIFMSLVVEAERDIRARLAVKLSCADWAPPALINVLALDDIEIARPIISNSPVLQDHDLVRLLVEATIEHQIEVARRPNLGPPVVAAILRQGEPAVLTALAGNYSASVGPQDIAQLVSASERVVALRAPLSHHPALTANLARELYVWVGQAIRASLASRFRLDADELDAALGASVREAYGGHTSPGSLEDLVIHREGEREEMEQQLLAKLDDAGQLRPGYLLRALREGKLSLFVGGMATLGKFQAIHVRQALNAEKPELLALACAAVGIDRSVFPTILELVRDLNGGRPGGGPHGARRAIGAFGPLSADVAAEAFRRAVADN